MAAMANERCTMAGATSTLCSSVRGGTSLCTWVARFVVCLHNNTRSNPFFCTRRRLMPWSKPPSWCKASGASGKGGIAYGGHGVGVEQNGRPEHGRSVLLQLTARAKLSGRSRCCSEARTWRTSRANSKRCRPNNEKR